jgi:hypothetical protein
MTTDSVPPTAASPGFAVPAEDLATRIVSLHRVSPKKALSILHGICISPRLAFLEILLAPFYSEATDYTHRTVVELGRCRTLAEVVEVVGYWEERRPLEFRAWPARCLALNERYVIQKLETKLKLE